MTVYMISSHILVLVLCCFVVHAVLHHGTHVKVVPVACPIYGNDVPLKRPLI
jgi:hypothetical protein